MTEEQLHQALPYLVSAPLIVLVLVIRMRWMASSRPLRLEWLWVTPAIFLAITAAAMASVPPTDLDILWSACALGVGGIVGWRRGKTMHVEVDPQTHALSARASPAAMIFLVVLLATRFVLRGLAMVESGALGVSPALITDLFLAFALGLLAAQRIEMALRARRLLVAARAASPAAG